MSKITTGRKPAKARTGKKAHRPGRRRTREQYERLCEVYAAQQVAGTLNHAAAARDARVDRRNAREAWVNGWNLDLYPWAVPIQSTHKRAQLVARQQLEQDKLKTERERAKLEADAVQHAAAVKHQEGKLVEVVRGAAGALLSQCAKMIKASGPLANRLMDELQALADLQGDDAPSVASQMATLRNIRQHARGCAELVETAMRLERLHLGEPETIIGVQAKMTLEEALVILASDGIEQQVGAGMREHLRLIDGGQAPTPGGAQGRGDHDGPWGG